VRKILLADDSVTAQNMGRKILTEAGYEVITVNNGSSALKKVTEAKPDLIVLDVYMPGYGGLEVCQRLREMPESSRIPVLISVGKLEPFRAEDARKAGADAHIVKPFEATELLAAINKLEDQIVPRGQGKRYSRPPRVAPDEGSELKDGWKDRLPTVISKSKKTARDWEDWDDAPQEKPAKAPGEVAEIVPKPAPQQDFPVVRSVAAEDEEPAGEIAEPTQEISETRQASLAAPEEVTPVTLTGSASPPAAGLAESEVAAALATLGGNEPGASFAGQAYASAEAAIVAGPRWIAEEVPLTDDEATCVLEHEMDKALAALAAAPFDLTASNTSPVSPMVGEAFAPAESSAVDSSEIVSELNAEEPSFATFESQTIPPAQDFPPSMEPEPGVASADMPSADGIDRGAQQSPEAVPVPAAQELAAYAAAASASAAVESPAISELQPASFSEPSAITSAASSEPEAGHQMHEAWANWKQIRDSVIGSQVAVPLSGELGNACTEDSAESPGSHFRDLRHETPASPPEAQVETASDADEAGEIASIVDSVLADLKPKLMEEIARKMGKSKKK